MVIKMRNAFYLEPDKSGLPFVVSYLDPCYRRWDNDSFEDCNKKLSIMISQLWPEIPAEISI